MIKLLAVSVLLYFIARAARNIVRSMIRDKMGASGMFPGARHEEAERDIEDARWEDLE